MVFGIVIFSIIVIFCIIGLVDAIKEKDWTGAFGIFFFCLISSVSLYFLIMTAVKGNTNITTYEFSSEQYDWHVVENVEPKLVIVDSVATIQYDTTKVLFVYGEERSISAKNEPGKKVTSKLIDKRKKH